MLSFQDLDETSSHSGAYSGFRPGGRLKILPVGQKKFWVSPPLEQLEPPPKLLKLT